ncbi:MAG: hypothetical protein AABW46_02930 [Nanoarchaeota archaeon]
MKIFICCSKHFYHQVKEIKKKLEEKGHTITLPNSFDEPFAEDRIRNISKEEHHTWKEEMLRLQEQKVSENDALLVLNFDKGGLKNYIGGATFLEMFKAWELKKKIFLYNPIPENILTDELHAFNPKIIHGNLEEIS